ncbi:hypothetical protein STP55_orf00039 [Salmonella phage STP55]|nr:hypothetical protein STP55_orf00039 [Salmonella phage STP55]
MIFIVWVVFAFLAMADIGKYHLIPSGLTVLLYGMVSYILGYVRARLLSE